MTMLGISGLTTAAMLTLSPVSLTASTNSHVITIESLSDLSDRALHQPKQTLFIVDIDDTLIDHPEMLGSKAWRKYIIEATQKIDPKVNWHDIFSYYLARHYPVQTVEKGTSQFVKNLQESGYVVCGLTSRERNLWYDMPQKGVDALTANQLRSVGIDLDTHQLEDVYPNLSKDTEYSQGIFFANIEPKGHYLSHLLKCAPQRPQKVIFIDDKESQVESVANALSQLSIPHECYLYTASNEKCKSFNPLIANIQLYMFYASNGTSVLSDLDAAQIALQYPDKSIEDYLISAMGLAKNK